MAIPASMSETSYMSTNSQWIPLMEYAMKKGVSLSTLRRHIKADKVTYRFENGKYLLLDDGKKSSDGPSSEEVDTLHTRMDQMDDELRQAKEEIAELKMLLALYEEKIPRAKRT